MTPDDVKAFGVELGKTAELFGEPLSEARVLLYVEALADLDFKTVLAGFQRARAEMRFFPKPAEIRELIEGTKDDRAEIAWARFLGAVRDVGGWDSVDFGDAALHAVIIDIWGGWPEACKLDEDDTPYRHRDFLKAYRLRANQRGDLRSGHLPGLTEVDNRRRGFLKHIPPVLQIGGRAPRRTPALAS